MNISATSKEEISTIIEMMNHFKCFEKYFCEKCSLSAFNQKQKPEHIFKED